MDRMKIKSRLAVLLSNARITLKPYVLDAFTDAVMKHPESASTISDTNPNDLDTIKNFRYLMKKMYGRYIESSCDPSCAEIVIEMMLECDDVCKD